MTSHKDLLVRGESPDHGNHRLSHRRRPHPKPVKTIAAALLRSVPPAVSVREIILV
jgi:hypothetical protein